MKRCSHCRIEKDVSEFNKNRAQKDGLQNVCKICLRGYVQDWERRHVEERKDYFSQWHKDNIERRHERNNLLFRRRYHSDPKFKERKVKQKRQSHIRKRATDPAWLEKVRMWSRNSRRRRRVHQMNNGGSHSEAEWQELCKNFDYRCVACGKKTRLAQDHVIPLSKGGSDAIENIQPLCQNCNSQKHDKTIDYRK